MCAVIFPLTQLISLTPTMQQLVIALGFGLSVLSTLSVLFGPKIALLLSGADVDSNLSVTAQRSQRGGASAASSRFRSNRVGSSKASGRAESDNSSVGSGVSDDFDLFKMANNFQSRYFVRHYDSVQSFLFWASCMRPGIGENTLNISNHGDSRRIREKVVLPKKDCIDKPIVEPYVHNLYPIDMIAECEE